MKHIETLNQHTESTRIGCSVNVLESDLSSMIGYLRTRPVFPRESGPLFSEIKHTLLLTQDEIPANGVAGRWLAVGWCEAISKRVAVDGTDMSGQCMTLWQSVELEAMCRSRHT